jgi:hypothetical protein
MTSLPERYQQLCLDLLDWAGPHAMRGHVQARDVIALIDLCRRLEVELGETISKLRVLIAKHRDRKRRKDNRGSDAATQGPPPMRPVCNPTEPVTTTDPTG